MEETMQRLHCDLVCALSWVTISGMPELDGFTLVWGTGTVSAVFLPRLDLVPDKSSTVRTTIFAEKARSQLLFHSLIRFFLSERHYSDTF